MNWNLRQCLIPNKPNNRNNFVSTEIEVLDNLRVEHNFDIIFHHMFMRGINDDWEDVYDLIKFMNMNTSNELRILQYNKCDRSSIYPTDQTHFKEILKVLNQHVLKLKVQHSAGSEIKSACGQFIMSKIL